MLTPEEEFHGPDEDLEVEDLIPDLDLTTPEERAEIDEVRWCVDAALAGLPPRVARDPPAAPCRGAGHRLIESGCALDRGASR